MFGLLGIGETIERFLNGGDDVSIFGEAREAVTAGCFGLIMSSVFFFAAFFLTIAWLGGGIEGIDIQLDAIAAPLLMLLCVSGFVSPFTGILIGGRGGKYYVTQHCGCLLLYLLVIVFAIFGLSFAL